LSLLVPLRPSLEARGGADEVTPALQGEAALGSGILGLVEVRSTEVAVNEHGVRQRPPAPTRCSAGCYSGE